PELLGLCDRVLVIREGTVAGELGSDEMSEEAIIRLASGLKHTTTHAPEHAACSALGRYTTGGRDDDGHNGAGFILEEIGLDARSWS
ncbi:UNVERIFIED_CONTAM: hypothetical protein ODX46_14130, partial [Salmonella enterica subsp. enterica serovar Enteritidis]